jgi:hypothetical protein
MDTEFDIYDTPDDTKPIRFRVVKLRFVDKFYFKEAYTKCGQQFVLKRQKMFEKSSYYRKTSMFWAREKIVKQKMGEYKFPEKYTVPGRRQDHG